MTAKSDFTPEEWETVLEGPTAAGLMIAASQRGGSFRESYSIAKAYTDARRDHGASQLLDDIVGEKPKVERPHVHSVDELKQQSLEQLRRGLALVEQKGTAEEADQYKQFVVGLATRVAEAHREGFLGFSGDRVSDAERQAVAEVAGALGVPAPSL
ncbi:MAG TPA: hypothetical protein VFQ71_04105 [Gaiellales bacterium]|jgi:hypothetical protein|nr:hypothetical protein [Gaiellales bacterium]